MRVIPVSTLKAFWKGKPQYRDAEAATLAWYRDVLKADWSKPSDVKAKFASASILQDGRVVFNIGGNNIASWFGSTIRTALFISDSSAHIGNTTPLMRKAFRDLHGH